MWTFLLIIKTIFHEISFKIVPLYFMHITFNPTIMVFNVKVLIVKFWFLQHFPPASSPLQWPLATQSSSPYLLCGFFLDSNLATATLYTSCISTQTLCGRNKTLTGYLGVNIRRIMALSSCICCSFIATHIRNSHCEKDGPLIKVH